MISFVSALSHISLLLYTIASTATIYQPNFEQQVLAATSDTYKAPLRVCDGSPGNIVKGRYIVVLFPGISSEDHFRNIRRGVGRYGVRVLNHIFGESIGYSCSGISDKVLEDIRADTSVKEVFCVPEQVAIFERPGRA